MSDWKEGIRAGLARVDRGELEAARRKILADLEAHRPQLEAAARGHREACAEVERLGLPAPDDVEGMIHLGLVAGIPEQEVLRMTWRQIFAQLLAFVDRERLRLNLAQEAKALLDGSRRPERLRLVPERNAVLIDGTEFRLPSRLVFNAYRAIVEADGQPVKFDPAQRMDRKLKGVPAAVRETFETMAYRNGGTALKPEFCKK